MNRFRVHIFGVVALLLVSANVFGQDTSFGFGGDACDGRVRADPGSTCLLYTSPSPRDGLLSRMPSSA